MNRSVTNSYLPPVWEAKSCRNLLATLNKMIKKDVNMRHEKEKLYHLFKEYGI